MSQKLTAEQRTALLTMWRADLVRLGITGYRPKVVPDKATATASFMTRAERKESRQMMLRVVERLTERGFLKKQLTSVWGTSWAALNFMLCRARKERRAAREGVNGSQRISDFTDRRGGRGVLASAESKT